MIARDHLGNICGGRHGLARGSSVEEMEVRAILEGLRLTVEKNWHNIIVESDALTVINHLRGTHFL